MRSHAIHKLQVQGSVSPHLSARFSYSSDECLARYCYSNICPYFALPKPLSYNLLHCFYLYFTRK